MKDISISYNGGNGKMLIHLDNFFPTSQTRFKKLLKIIGEDWYHREELLETLKVYFQEKIPECEAEFKANGKAYFDWKEKEAEAKRRIESRKAASGVPLSADELKRYKELKKESSQNVKECMKLANAAKRNKERYSAHLEYLKSTK